MRKINFTNEILKSCESSRHAHQIRVHSASVRCANCRTSLHLSTESDVRSDPKKASSRRRDHANFAPKSRERNANFSELRRASRRKNACIRPACVAQTACRRCTCQTSRQCVQIRRKTRVRRRAHRNFTQKIHKRNLKELRKFEPRAQNSRVFG